jgi:hypothetical protein
MIDTADSYLPTRQVGLSRTSQALALSVARWCTVEGSRPDGARPVALMCSEPKAYVPGWLDTTRWLGRAVLASQSVFNWIDLTS